MICASFKLSVLAPKWPSLIIYLSCLGGAKERMKFCPRCGVRLKLKQFRKSSPSVTYSCDNCGYSKNESGVMQDTKGELSNSPQIKVVGDKEANWGNDPIQSVFTINGEPRRVVHKPSRSGRTESVNLGR